MDNRVPGFALGLAGCFLCVGAFLPWLTLGTLSGPVSIVGTGAPDGYIMLAIGVALVVCAVVIGRPNAGLAGKNVALALATHSIVVVADPFAGLVELNRDGYDAVADIGLLLCTAGAITGTAAICYAIRSGARSPAEDIDLRVLFGSVRGRITRGQYWTGFIALRFASSILATLVLLIAPAEGEPTFRWWGVLIIAPLAFGLYAVAAKRFQDRGKPGLLALFAVVPAFGLVAATSLMGNGPPDGPWFVIPALLVAAISLWLLIELGFLAGEDGPNRYGPDLLGPEESQPGYPTVEPLSWDAPR